MGNDRIVLAGLRRTFIGKRGGALALISAHELMSRCLAATLAKTTCPAEKIDDVIVGNVRNSVGNIARVAAIEAGVPQHVPACTVDRQCASGLEAVSVAAARIKNGEARIILAGGVESASRCPWMFEKTARGYAYGEPRPYEVLLAPRSTGNTPMGQTAETLAQEFAISRDDQDQFAFASHQKAAAAQAQQFFDAELCALEGISSDECVRPNTSLNALSNLRTVFDDNGTVTAGNSSPLNDGAASCLVLSEQTAQQLGIQPQVAIGPIDVVGLDPNRMGLGPAITLPRLFKKADLTPNAVDLFEINEAFAAQILASLQHLKKESSINIPSAKLNIRGGAISLGHPLGATGLRLLVTLAHALAQNNLKRGVVSMCVGGGQGMSAVIEQI